MCFKVRSNQQEYIDLGDTYYTQDEYRDCLYQMGRIGRLLGSDWLTLRAFKKIDEPINSILDVGCGGGSFTLRLAQKYPKAQVRGIDISQKAIEYAQQKIKKHPIANLAYSVPPKPELTEPAKSYDVVTSTLVCHHLDDITLVEFLKRAAQVARKAVIINDLQRSCIAYAGFAIISRIFFRNRLIIHDGLLSIKRSFKKADWQKLLSQAGFKPEQYSIKRSFLFRWIVTIRTQDQK